MWNKIKPFVISCIIPLAVGGLSALFTKNGMESYSHNILQPPFSPPMYIFPIVWSILYILMGIGSAIVFLNCSNDKESASSALRFYGLQLIVNFFWSIIFFNMRAYLFAFVWLILLFCLIVTMTILFNKLSHIAALMQIPYLIWTSFAGYLTLMVWLLNS